VGSSSVREIEPAPLTGLSRPVEARRDPTPGFIRPPRLARAGPELAVRSAMAHGWAGDTQTSVRIAMAAVTASARLDRERATV